MAACDVLNDARQPLTSVSVSGRVPAHGGNALSLLATAERLAAEYGFVVDLRVDGAAYEIRFHRRAS